MWAERARKEWEKYNPVDIGEEMQRALSGAASTCISISWRSSESEVSSRPSSATRFIANFSPVLRFVTTVIVPHPPRPSSHPSLVSYSACTSDWPSW